MSTRTGVSLDSTAIITLAVFAALALLIVILSARQSARQKAGMEQFAASHGWRFLGTDSSQVKSMLAQIGPNEDWIAENLVLVDGPPESVSLFSYSSGTRPSSAHPKSMASHV